MASTSGTARPGATSIDDARGREATDARSGEKPGFFSAAKLAFTNFRQHNMTDRGAALTYFLVMSIFPVFLVAISLLGLFGQASTVTSAVGYLKSAGAPPGIVQVIGSSLTSITSASAGKALLPAIIGVVIALNGASGAFGGAGRALNVAFGEAEERGFVKKKGTQLIFTLACILLGIVALVSVFVGGKVAVDLFGYIGLGSTVGQIWTYARWIVALLATMLIFGIVYAFAPDIPKEKFRFISPGAIVAVLLWIVLSAAFFFYVQNFSNYSATYGAFATPVVLLLWLYLTSLAFLFGGELNGVYERMDRGKPKTATVEAGDEA